MLYISLTNFVEAASSLATTHMDPEPQTLTVYSPITMATNWSCHVHSILDPFDRIILLTVVCRRKHYVILVILC
jgi:hypothetical protein